MNAKQRQAATNLCTKPKGSRHRSAYTGSLTPIS